MIAALQNERLKMLEFDLETWCEKHSYVTLAQTKSVAFGFAQSLFATEKACRNWQKSKQSKKRIGLNFD